MYNISHYKVHKAFNLLIITEDELIDTLEAS